MKIVVPEKESIIIVDGELYQLDAEDKTVDIGTMLFDGRHEQFMIAENEKDVKDYFYVAPEAYVIFKKIEIENIMP